MVVCGGGVGGGLVVVWGCEGVATTAGWYVVVRQAWPVMVCGGGGMRWSGVVCAGLAVLGKI